MIFDSGPHSAASGMCDGSLVSPNDENELILEFPSELREIGTAKIYSPHDDAQQHVRCPVLTRDFSAGGFRIVLTRPLQPSQRIELDVAAQRFIGEIVWCREAEFGFFLVGCRLVQSN